MSAVLRIPRTESLPNAFVLVKVTPNGSEALDLKFVATEGEAPYVVSLKHSQVHALRSKTASCNDAEWRAILQALLLKTSPDKLQGAEMVAAVAAEKAITLTIRRHVEGITQRLGTIVLKHEDDEAIELFDWAGMLCQTVTELRDTTAEANEKLQGQAASFADLEMQLNALIKAKEEHERELLGKFQLLLNAKKAKIRDQQRLLAHYDIDPEVLAKVEASKGDGAVGRRKRKARSGEEEEEEESDDGFEAMDTAGDAYVDESDEDGGEVDASDKVTDAEDDSADEDDKLAPIADRTRATTGASDTPAASSPMSKNDEATKQRKAPASHKKMPVVEQDDDDADATASEEDDEL